ncbi:peroxiredoxin family protein [Rurimicrobium arvi]|uniref:Thioredoxin domain-containing protein n=1 Tax=Rurimicrobium arvi TaxID=2049916 RepID=A0ABP8MSZ9_9BACT
MHASFLKKTVLSAIFLVGMLADASAQLYPGQFAPSFSAKDIDGRFHSVEQYKGRKILMTFYRNISSFPSLARFLEIEQQKEYFRSKDIVVLAVFPSTKEVLQRFRDTAAYYQIIISDSEQALYRLFEIGDQASFRPKLLGHKKPAIKVEKSKLKGIEEKGMSDKAPADILIDAGGNIFNSYYGKYESDHIPLSKLKELIDSL